MPLTWLRARLFGPPDPMKPILVEKLDSEMSKLNGATLHLTETVETIKQPKNRQSMSDTLNDALDAIQKEFRR